MQSAAGAHDRPLPHPPHPLGPPRIHSGRSDPERVREPGPDYGKCKYECVTSTPALPCCPGFEGAGCATQSDPCRANPCGAGAKVTTCLPGSDGGRVCKCRPGYAGNPDGQCVEDPSARRMLSNANFTQGTFRITEPGVYVFSEDVVFNPNSRAQGGNSLPRPDQLSTGGGPYDARAYRLGFFAAITVECDGVEIDFDGRSLRQHREHALMQRFFAAIELNEAPFVYDQGPSNFTANPSLASGSNVLIHGGTIGLSSHHSIHGTGTLALEVRDMTLRDFEVAGISLNGGRGLLLTNLIIGPSRVDVPVRGIFSTALFNRPYVEAAAQSCPTATIEIDGRTRTAQQVLDELVALIDDTYDAVLCGKGEIPALVDNSKAPGFGLPDGSAIYGIVLHNFGSHTNGFVMERKDQVCFDVDSELVGMVDAADTIPFKRCRSFQPSGNDNVVVDNVRIQGLRVRVNEVEALSTTTPSKDKAGAVIKTAQLDPVFAVLQYEVMVDAQFGKAGPFKGNTVAQAQLFIAKNQQCIEAAPTTCKRATAPAAVTGCQRDARQTASGVRAAGDPSGLPTQLNTIRPATIEWAAKGGYLPQSAGTYICAGDNMFHVNKGAFGMRIDAGENVLLRSVVIDGVDNTAPPASTLCAAEDKHTHPLQAQPWYTGSDAVGISLASCKPVTLEQVSIRRISSFSGNAYGVSLIMDSDDVEGTLAVGEVTTSLNGDSGAARNTYRIGTRPRMAANCCLNTRDDPCAADAACIPIATPIFVDDYACVPGMAMMGPDFGDMCSMQPGGCNSSSALPFASTCALRIKLESLSAAPSITFEPADHLQDSCPARTGGSSSGGGDGDGTLIAVGLVVLVLTAACAAGFVFRARARRHAAQLNASDAAKLAMSASGGGIVGPAAESAPGYMDVSAPAPNPAPGYVDVAAAPLSEEAGYQDLPSLGEASPDPDDGYLAVGGAT